MEKKMLFPDWVLYEAKKINSDACTKSFDFHVQCCYVHDLSYYYGRCACCAYKLYLNDSKDVWGEAPTATRLEIDQTFRNCIQTKSSVRKASPLSWVRYAGVRVGGWWAWRKHRKARP